MANSDLVLSVAKALDVLQYLVSQPDGCRLRDMAAHFGMKTPALYNILRTMTDRGFLRKSANGRYVPGETLHRIADQLPDNLAKEEKLLSELHRKYPAAVITLAEISSHAIICLRRISPDAPDMIQVPVNRSFPPYSGVTGLVTVSNSGMSDWELENRWPFEEFGTGEWESREKLLAAVAKCREDGFAIKQRNSALTLALALSDGRTLGFAMPDCDLKHGAKFLKEIRKAAEGMKI